MSLLGCKLCEVGTVSIFYLLIFSVEDTCFTCVGFCHTSAWTNHTDTHVPSLLKTPALSHLISPSRLSQSTGLSTLCHTANSHWLSISHTVMYVSILFSQLILPSRPPTEPTSLFSYVSISIAALQIGSLLPSF